MPALDENIELVIERARKQAQKAADDNGMPVGLRVTYMEVGSSRFVKWSMSVLESTWDGEWDEVFHPGGGE